MKFVSIVHTLRELFPGFDIAYQPSIDAWHIWCKHRNFVCTETIYPGKFDTSFLTLCNIVKEIQWEIDYYLDAIWC
jgi:hypothetical protein